MHQPRTRSPTTSMRGNQEATPGTTRAGRRKLGRRSPRSTMELAYYPNTTTQDTPFFMVYGAKAVLPHDLKFRAPRISGYEEEEAEEALQDDKDTKDEARDTTLARSEGYQDKLRTYQSSRLRTRTFNKGDLVLQLIQQ